MRIAYTRQVVQQSNTYKCDDDGKNASSSAFSFFCELLFHLILTNLGSLLGFIPLNFPSKTFLRMNRLIGLMDFRSSFLM